MSGSTFNTQLRIFCEGHVEKTLHFLYESSQAKAKLGYKTHNKLKSSLEQLLQANAQSIWNTMKETTSTRTIAAFNERAQTV